MTIDVHHPTEEFLRSIDIHTLLPQKEPFVMTGSIIAYDDSHTDTEFLIQSGNLFVRNGGLSTSGMVENIAQTCTARIGYYNKYILKKDIQPGVIAAIRNMKVICHPCIGSIMHTSITIIGDAFGMILADAKIISEDDIVSTAQVKMALKS